MPYVREQRPGYRDRPLRRRSSTANGCEHDSWTAASAISTMQEPQLESRCVAGSLVEKMTMRDSITLAPPNSIIAVADAPTSSVPTLRRGESIVSTRACILVACLMFQDGETKVTFGRPINPKDRPVFDGFLYTPHRKVAVWTVPWDKVLETGAPTTRTRILIWTNHPTEPDDVYIGVGE
jgi:hypothetical protein